MLLKRSNAENKLSLNVKASVQNPSYRDICVFETLVWYFIWIFEPPRQRIFVNIKRGGIILVVLALKQHYLPDSFLFSPLTELRFGAAETATPNFDP